MSNTVKEINALRLANKNQWHYWQGTTTDGKDVSLKAYGTWVQILQIDGRRDSGPIDCTVGDFKAYLAKYL